jgi:sulfoxide reductase heme-binding subunit YedZ
MGTQILWFTTRGSGIVSLILATVVVCLGILTTMRWQRSEWPRFLTAELHRSIALLSIAFLALHIVTAVLDPFTALGWAAAVIPFASSYRPIWVAFGVISMDLGIAVVITSLLRDRIGLRAWRLVHWASYAAWPMAVIHTVGSGSDAFAPWMLGVTAACVLAVGLAAAWRVAWGRTNRDGLESVAAGRHVAPIPAAAVRTTRNSSTWGR